MLKIKLPRPRSTQLKNLLGLLNQCIYTGPFSGLKIPAAAKPYLSIPEILGLYESCLHPALSDLTNRNIRSIVQVGGHNGYYAAGLHQLFNPSILRVFELDTALHPIILDWFRENSFPPPKILGRATPEIFGKLTAPVDLVLMDCEGAERELLDPVQFRWQAYSDIIVELHPFYTSGLLTAQLSERFRNTHSISFICDCFQEDAKINNILTGLKTRIDYPKHPRHRWILQESRTVFTSGTFLVLKRKDKSTATNQS